MPRPRRLLRHSAIAPDGRRYVVEEVPRGRLPQVRVWDSTARRYQRLTLAVSLRDAEHRPNPLAIREALRLAEDLVMTQLNPAAAPAPTMKDLFTYATGKYTGPARSTNSRQSKEWERAVREANAVIPEALPVSQFDGRHITVVSLSALLRTAVGHDLPQWQASAERVRTAVMLDDLDAATKALHAIYTSVSGRIGMGCAASAAAVATAASRWPVLCAQLLRAMCRHCAEKHSARFGAAEKVKIEKDQLQQLTRMREASGIAEPPVRPNRARYAPANCRDLLRALSDPRYDMQTLIAAVSSDDGAYRVSREDIRIENGLVYVGIDTGGQARKAINWRPLSADASAAFRELVDTAYSEFEAQFVETRTNYFFLEGHVWTGQQLRVSATGRLPKIDPRYRLLLYLGVERRSEQMLDCRRGHLVVVNDEGNLGLDARTQGTKRADLQMLTPSQERRLGFALRFGYLADLERAHRAQLAAVAKRRAEGDRMPMPVPDYPLFPAGRLAGGRAKASDALQPANDRTLDDWNRQVEQALGIDHEEGRALRGWRRAFADLYEDWTDDIDIKNRLMDHARALPAERGSTRERVYLNPASLRTLKKMAALVEYARVQFPRTGRPPVPTVDATGER
jgi:hypothetical protein